MYIRGKKKYPALDHESIWDAYAEAIDGLIRIVARKNYDLCKK